MHGEDIHDNATKKLFGGSKHSSHGEDIHDYATKKLLVVPSTHGCLQTMQKRVAWASKKK